jgi:periplasmic divalent cation tolerance protein
MRKADGEVLVLTTLDHEEKAEAFGQAIVEAKLAACVTRLPAGVSMYRWQKSEITVEREHVLLIKTHRDKLAELEAFFKREHPYEVPEILVFSADSVSEAYGSWMRSEMNLK